MTQRHPASLNHGSEFDVPGYPGLEGAECGVCRGTILNDGTDPANAWRHVDEELDAPGADPRS